MAVKKNAVAQTLGTGRRKSSVARVRLIKGTGKVIVNDKPLEEYFGDGSHFGVKIEYFVEETPLGTAGALFKMPQLTEDFLLLCGDVIFID